MCNASGVETVGYWSSEFPSYTGSVLTAFGRGLCGASSTYSRFVSVSTPSLLDYLGNSQGVMLAHTSGPKWVIFRGNAERTSISGSLNTDVLLSSIFDGTNCSIRDGTNTGTAANTGAFSVTQVLVGAEQQGSPKTALNSKYAEVTLWTANLTSQETTIRAALAY